MDRAEGPALVIVGREASHYTRQVRMLAHELGIAYRPVSYTHLDVYKRQL